MGKIEIVKGNDEWLELLKESKFHTIFHSQKFEEIITHFKWIKPLHILFTDNQNSRCLIPFFYINKDRYVSVPFCEYGGPVLLDNSLDFGDMVTELQKYFGRNRFQIKLHPYVNHALRSNLDQGSSELCTHILNNFRNVNNEKELLLSFRKTTRHSVEKASKQIVLKEGNNENELKEFYKLYTSTMKHKRSICFPFLFIRRLWDTFRKNNKISVVLAKYKDKTIAANIFLYYNNGIHYYLSSSDFRYRNLGANYTILWNELRSAINKKRDFFDFGATRENTSLETFKAGWGGKKYSLNIYQNYPATQINENSLSRRLWGKMPDFLVRGLSGKLIKHFL